MTSLPAQIGGYMRVRAGQWWIAGLLAEGVASLRGCAGAQGEWPDSDPVRGQCRDRSGEQQFGELARQSGQQQRGKRGRGQGIDLADQDH